MNDTSQCGEHGTLDPELGYCKCELGWSQPEGAVRLLYLHVNWRYEGVNSREISKRAILPFPFGHLHFFDCSQPQSHVLSMMRPRTSRAHVRMRHQQTTSTLVARSKTQQFSVFSSAS